MLQSMIQDKEITLNYTYDQVDFLYSHGCEYHTVQYLCM